MEGGGWKEGGGKRLEKGKEEGRRRQKPEGRRRQKPEGRKVEGGGKRKK